MRAGPDLLGALSCSDGELDLAPVDFRHLSLPGDQASNRRRREMPHVDGGANRALAWIEISPDCIEGGVFHDHDHDGSGEYWRQCRVFEPVCKMLRLDEEVEGALGSNGYLPHGFTSKGRDDRLSSLRQLLPGVPQMIRERFQPLSSGAKHQVLGGCAMGF